MEMDHAWRQELIECYAAGYDIVAEALDGIMDAELDAHGADGWTARQVVHHLADSETTSYIRLRCLLAEERPLLAGYDEAAFARRLHYDRPITASIEVFRAVRQATLELLTRLTEDEWAREGTHIESGRYAVETWLRIYAAHAHDHAAQIRRARSGARPGT